MFTLNCKGKIIVVDKPAVMGIINVTPDSFYPGSRVMDKENILAVVEKMLGEGADMIDIGGQSTRPGSHPLPADEEAGRVIDVIDAIHDRFPHAILSIDTYHASVAKQAVDAGACIVNDISAGKMDKDMLPLVAKLKVPYVIMHMKGTPENMQDHAQYENVAREVLDFLIERKKECNEAGIHDIIIDPGFGFAKTIAHNFELLQQLSVFKMIGVPLLAGLSRKSTIYKTLGITAEESLNGTTVLNTIALMNGASILRVHDVKEAKEAVTLWSKVNSQK